MQAIRTPRQFRPSLSRPFDGGFSPALAQTGTANRQFCLAHDRHSGAKAGRGRVCHAALFSHRPASLPRRSQRILEAYSRYQSLKMALLIGGTSVRDQENELTKGVDVLIATSLAACSTSSSGALRC